MNREKDISDEIVDFANFIDEDDWDEALERLLEIIQMAYDDGQDSVYELTATPEQFAQMKKARERNYQKIKELKQK